MRILKLEAENVKRLRAVRIAPKGNAVVIGGRNAQGKSSVLDAIQAALGGKGAAPAEPLRRGADRGHVVLELDDLVVKRTFTEGGGSQLVVTTKDGAKHAAPQTILDKLVGELSFDPLRFTRMEPKEQVATLRALGGLDFSALDAQRAKAFAERTEVGRELKRTGAMLEQSPHHDGAPAAEVSMVDLLAELETRRGQNRANKADRDKLEAMRSRAKSMVDRIEQLERELAAAKEELAKAQAEGKVFAGQVAALIDADEAELVERIRTAEQTNAKVRANAARDKLEEEMQRLAEQQTDLTASIEAIDEDKREQLAAAKFAVPGLAFDEHGVTLNGLPFEQASSAEQLRVSVAIGLAMNPKLKVLLIRDGALLDDDSLAAVAAQAAEADAQLWIERVGTDGAPTVVIEDGEVRDAAEKAGAA